MTRLHLSNMYNCKGRLLFLKEKIGDGILYTVSKFKPFMRFIVLYSPVENKTYFYNDNKPCKRYFFRYLKHRFLDCDMELRFYSGTPFDFFGVRGFKIDLMKSSVIF